VTFPGGARLAIEVQLGKITDSELLARREDYTRAGIALAWVWQPR
jgi:competence CoiA-like predicted nuclease